MEEVPTFYTELTDKVLRVKNTIGRGTDAELVRVLYNLYCFCLGAVAQHTEDDAK